MSALFNLLVGGTAAEDIYCNGQEVEEVWVDGVQVFDAYDPQAVPNGTMSFTSFGRSFAETYSEAQQGLTVASSGQVGATGSIYLATGLCETFGTDVRGDSSRDIDVNFVDSSGNPYSMGLSVHATLGVYYSNGAPLFTLDSYSRPNYGGSSGNELRVAGAAPLTILSGSERYNGQQDVTLAWNFKTRQCTISSSSLTNQVTRSFSQKWKPGMYVKLTLVSGTVSQGAFINSYGYRETMYDIYARAGITARAGN